MSVLQSIRLRALALRSSVHNEQQLSALELSAMCAKKTNELIEVVNDLTYALENGAFKYDAATESLTFVAGGEK